MLAFNPYQAYGIPDKTKTLVAPAKNGKRAKYAVDLHAQPGQALRDDDACYTLVQYLVCYTNRLNYSGVGVMRRPAHQVLDADADRVRPARHC